MLIFGELIDETLERELREATNELPFAGRYDNVTKKILLLGEMDYMPSKVKPLHTPHGRLRQPAQTQQCSRLRCASQFILLFLVKQVDRLNLTFAVFFCEY